MLKLIDITKEYMAEEESVLALHDVSIEFRKNEFVSILGPSGCGKTTLLNIIGGLDRYDSGDLIINGISTKKSTDYCGLIFFFKISMVFFKFSSVFNSLAIFFVP